MKPMDEMERSIQLRAEEVAYKAVLGGLAGSTCATWLQAFLTKQAPDLVPGLLLCLAVCIQGFTQVLYKHRMVEDDEEYREPNHPARMLGAAVALGAFLLFVGLLLMAR